VVCSFDFGEDTVLALVCGFVISFGLLGRGFLGTKFVELLERKRGSLLMGLSISWKVGKSDHE